MIKAEFSASLLQSSVSHDPSEIILICWFAAQETFMIIINVENSCVLFFRIPWWIESSKEQHLSEIQSFCNIIHYRSKVWGQEECLLLFFWKQIKEINTFIQQGCIKSIKSDSKDIYNVTKDYISNKCCSFELSIHQRILKRKYCTQ